IGFKVREGLRDPCFYDSLASEVRLCSFLAIVEGQVPQDHWFSLGRLLVAPGGEPILVSWSGSMFEYLMPLLVMPSYRGTLLDRACQTAVELQIEYGNSRDVPWGVSETSFNQGDVQMRGPHTQRRFMSRPLLKTANLLSQERLPETEASV